MRYQSRTRTGKNPHCTRSLTYGKELGERAMLGERKAQLRRTDNI